MNESIIKITCQFKFSKLTVEIPRILFYNYWEVWGSTENAMKIDRYRQSLTFDTPAELRRKFYLRNKDRFDRHDEIFKSVMVSHIYGDNDRIEYYLQYAVQHWLVEMENKRREPIEMLVTEVRRARAHPKVEVLKYATKKKVMLEIKNK
jgi:hypothetical protein